MQQLKPNVLDVKEDRIVTWNGSSISMSGKFDLEAAMQTRHAVKKKTGEQPCS